MPHLLDDPRYRSFLAQTHPGLRMTDDRLPVPSFVAGLDVREPMLPGPWRWGVSVARAFTKLYTEPDALFLGTPFERYDQTHLLERIEDPAALAAAAREVAGAEDLSVVVMTNVRAGHPKLPAFRAAGFVALPSFPDMVVPLAGATSFDAHLKVLPSGDRSGIRRNIRNFVRAGHTLERLSGAASAQLAEALHSHYRFFFERAAVRWQPHTEAYFAGLSALDDRVFLTVAKNPAGEVIGFVVGFADGDSYQAGRIGIRDDYYRKDGVYFRLLYHVLEEAIAIGAREVSLEPTSFRTKRHLGARPVPMVNLVLGVAPTWRLVLAVGAGFGRWLLRHLERPRALEKHYG